MRGSGIIALLAAAALGASPALADGKTKPERAGAAGQAKGKPADRPGSSDHDHGGHQADHAAHGGHGAKKDKGKGKGKPADHRAKRQGPAHANANAIEHASEKSGLGTTPPPPPR